MRLSRIHAAPAVIGLMILLSADLTNAIDAKCGACSAVVNAVFRRVDAELPKNALDMRHRLDKDGNRYGKVIDYNLSELRMDALLTSLCDNELKNYSWVEAGQEGVEGLWSEGRQKSLEAEEQAKQEQYSKELVGYCHNILETHEDNVIAAIRADKGSGDPGRSRLCFQLGICHAAADVKDEL